MGLSDQRHLAPKKSLGQNFLVDKNIIRKIVEALELSQGDSLIEIGPGEGALTLSLVEYPLDVFLAVEYDQRAVHRLGNKLPQARYPHFRLQHGDIRDIPLRSYAEAELQRTGRKLKIIGNIPYNITSDILFWLYDAAPVVERAIIMMQKEVAQRLMAKPRTKDYGILTVATLFAAQAKILFDVAPGCFFPRPAVTSSVVEIRFREADKQQPPYSKLRPLINAAFSQRRKVLGNALKTYLSSRTSMPYADIMQKAESHGISYFRSRAEELTPDDFIRMLEFIDSL